MIIPVGAIRKKAIINAFVDAGAISKDTAKTLNEIGVYKGLGIKFSQLQERGIIVQEDNDKYYLNTNSPKILTRKK